MPISHQPVFRCPGRVAAGPGSMPVCGAPDWNHDEHDYPGPSLKPTRGQPHDSESLDGCEGVGWDLSWGFRLNVGHDAAEDPTSPLTIGACFSDTDQARGIVVRETSPEQLEEFARLLLNVAAKHRQRMATRPNPSADGPVTTPAIVLNRLGTNPTQVAVNLHALDCRGERNDCLTCPVALYLLRSELNPVQVLVGDRQAEITFPDRHVETVDLPAAVRGFVAGFDQGRYDYLLKPVTAGDVNWGVTACL